MASDIRAQGSLIGSKLGGYQVEALIGRGAMGSVYLARDTKLNRHIALKVLLGSLARTPSIVKQFHQEAQSAAPLNHPNIVRIYSAGVEAGTPYIAMEFVDGEPLDRFLKRKGKVNWDVALHIGAQVALALDCAHQHGIIHRDVKPSNILLDRKGGVRLTDFGIARMQSRDGASGGPVVGTPQYMSPEQLTGGDIGPASDLFALGVTMYQMISGEMPFRGESSMALVRSICEDTPVRLNKLDESVPDDVARLVAYLIEKEPSGRPASAKIAYGLIHRLQKHRGGSSVVAESLTSFLKEEMEARPFSSIERKEAQTRKQSSKVRRRLRKGRISGALAAQAVAIAVLAAGAFAIGPFTAARGRERVPAPAKVLDFTIVQPVQPGVRRIGLLADGHEVDSLVWLGEEGALIAHTRGQRGTLVDGERGLLSIEVASATVVSLSAPDVPGAAAAKNRARPLPASFTAAPDAPVSSPLYASVPVFALGDDPLLAVLLAQPWRAATPRAAILYTAPRSAIDATRANGGAFIALHPAAERVCLALYDVDTGQYFLAEHALATPAITSTDERRTSPQADVIPESVRYTADGQRIAYLRRNATRGIDLWMLRSGATDLDGRRIASGLAEGVISMAPSENLAAVSIAGTDGAVDIALMDLQSGSVSANYGPGTLCTQAWLTDASGFLFVGPGPERQLVFAPAQPPYEPRPVTNVRGGVGPAYAVAPKSGQVAAADPSGDNPAVYVIDPETLSRAGS